MANLRQIKKCKTIADLEDLGIGPITAEIGGRGGKLWFNGSDVAEYVGCHKLSLPVKYGCYCNYLGGGIRGAIIRSGHGMVAGRQTALLDALGEACVRAYKHEEGGLNNEEYNDGEPNYDAIATNAARQAGIKSAY